MRKVWIPFGWTSAAFGAVAALLRLTLRDRLPLLSALYYGSPPAVIALLFAVPAAVALALKKRKLSGVLGVVALLAAAGQALPWRQNRPVAVEGSFRLMLWNVARGARGWDRVAERVRAQDPDLACFVEAGFDSAEQQKAWNAALPGHERRRWDGGLVLAVRGKIREAERLNLGQGGRALRARVLVRDREVTVVIVDLWADPFRSRREAFEALGRILEPLRKEPLVVLGDFNTPGASVHFDGWRNTFSQAFESAGSGYGATWPMPLPILDLDHVWLAPPLRAASCRLEGSAASDHRAVVAEIY